MNNIILREVSKIIIPLIQIFGIYIIFHGHISPGGGFAGGTVIGASLILYRLVYGVKKAKSKFPYKYLLNSIIGSMVFYGLLKGYSFITGGNHIHAPNLGLGNPGDIFSGGYLLPLNISVGIIVSITIYIFFSLFNEGDI